MNKKIYVIIVIVVAIIASFLFMNKQEVSVTNFEQCVVAGNPVMESYPRQCAHKGVTYVEDINEAPRNTPTSADNAPPGSIHNLPLPEAIAAVRAKVAKDAGVSEGLVIIISAYEKEWSDSCLGLGGPAEACLAVITPGFEVTLTVKGAERKYRTNSDGSEIRREK